MRMKQLILCGVMGGALIVGPVGMAAATDTPASNRADDRLEEKVEKVFEKNDSLSHLEVDVDEGVLSLKGEVATAAEKARAERLAKSAGAKRVMNNLEVDPDKAVARIKERAEARKDRIDDQAAAAKEKVDRQTEVAAERAEKGVVKAGEKVQATGEAAKPVAVERGTNKEVIDPLVTAKVKTRILKDDLLDKSDINVDSDADGLVTLKGTVHSDAAKARALELARTTEGVRRVVDQLVVKAPIGK